MSKLSNAPTGSADSGPPRWVYVVGTILAALVLGFVALHLAGQGLGNHAAP